MKRETHGKACGCCGTGTPATPETVHNRPGLSAIRYRIGTHASFRQALIDAIAAAEVEVDGETLRDPVTGEAERPLSRWTSRAGDDYGYVLLDLWAYLGDILTFYQERSANEAFLRTARHRDDVLRLAALLDYEPAPGMAATTYLAFTVEKEKTVEVPEGLLVQSVPSTKEEKPQKFETVEPLTARAALNAFRVYPEPIANAPLATLGETTATLHPESDASHLAPGDNLVVYEEQVPETGAGAGGKVKGKSTATPSLKTGKGSSGPGTIDAWGRALVEAAGGWSAGAIETIEDFLGAPGFDASDWILPGGASAGSPSAGVHVEDKRVKSMRAVDSRTKLEWEPGIRTPFTGAAKVHKWKRKLRLFGHDAPSSFLVSETVNGQVQWKTEAYDYGRGGSDTIVLDALLDDLKENTEILLVSSRDGAVKRATILTVEQVEAKVGPEDGPPLVQRTVTQATLDEVVPEVDARNAVVYEIAGPEVTPWGREYGGSVSGAAVYAPLSEIGLAKEEADGFLEADRRIALVDDEGRAHVATVTGASVHDDHLKIEITPSVDDAEALDASTAKAFANVALSTHGETVDAEILGNGDASELFQSFALAKSPVTFVPEAGAPHGAANTLGVRVDGIRWDEAETLHGRGPDERVYTTRVGEEGEMTVQFGDGATGARLPTGRSNVRATYRKGIGTGGNVGAEAITTLRDRPVGLKGVTNPIAASGGADPETLEDARENAPNTVRTFGRVVSLMDFEDAARAYAGIAKARAAWTWSGEERVVRLTVAGDDGTEVSDEALSNLRKDLDARRDPNQRLLLRGHEGVDVEVEAAIRVDDAYEADAVLAAAEAALSSLFAFDALDLGQPVHLSDVYHALQEVEGVVAADVDRFGFSDPAIRSHREDLLKDAQDRLRLLPWEIATLANAALNPWEEVP